MKLRIERATWKPLHVAIKGVVAELPPWLVLGLAVIAAVAVAILCG